MTINPTTYRWPDLSSIKRTYIVRDDQGRIGIATADHRGDEVIFAHPIDVPPSIKNNGNIPGAEAIPTNSILMTPTAFHPRADGHYYGIWYDYPGVGRVPETDIRRLDVISDIGYIMPDWVADQALTGSDQGGAWDYGAKLGKVGGEPPVKGQKYNEMTVNQAEDYAKEVGEQVTARAIRLAAKNGYIPDARKIGRDWLINYDGFNHYLDNRPKRGPKPSK